MTTASFTTLLIAALGLASVLLGKLPAKTLRRHLINNIAAWVCSLGAIALVISQSPRWYWWALFAVAVIAMVFHLSRLISFQIEINRKGVDAAIRDRVHAVYWRNIDDEPFVAVHKDFAKLGDMPCCADALHEAMVELREYEPIKIVLR